MYIIMKNIETKIKNILENNLIPSYEIQILLPKIHNFFTKYEKSNNCSIDSLIYLGKDGSILVFISKLIEIKIFTSEYDYLQYFGPLKKLNQIENRKDNNLVVNKLLDFDSENKIVVEERLIKISELFCKIFNKFNKSNDISKIKLFIIQLMKTYFRTIFLLYLKNDQTDQSLNLSNFGVKPNQLKLIKSEDFENIRILSQNFINSSYLHTSTDTNKVDNFIAKRSLFESFKNFRESILIMIHECNNNSFLIDHLKEYYEKLDNILTFEYESDKILKGKTEYVIVKSFKFLNIDDIISLVKKLI